MFAEPSKLVAVPIAPVPIPIVRAVFNLTALLADPPTLSEPAK